MITDYPFEKCTTQKVDYIRWPLAAPYRHVADPYLPPDGCISGETNYRLAYPPKPLCPGKSFKPAARKCPAGKFEDMTSNRADYRQ